MIGFMIFVTFVAIVVVAFFALIQKNLFDSIVLYGGLSLGSVVLFTLFKAPDVALTEAVIGAGVSSLIFITALKNLKKEEI